MTNSKLIDTPYGKKTPELLRKAMDAYEIQPRLISMIEKLEEHLDYTGWGDSWEWECSKGLRKSLVELNEFLQGARK